MSKSINMDVMVQVEMKRSNSGLTLIEMTVMLGILSIVILATSSSTLSAMKGAKNIALDREIEDSLLLVRQIVKDQSNCTPNLINNTFDTAALTAIPSPSIALNIVRSAVGVELLRMDSPLRGVPSVIVRSIKVEDLIQVTTFTKYVGSLKVEFLKPAEKILGPSIIVRKFPITLLTSQIGTSNDARVDGCYLEESNSQEGMAKAWAVFQGGHSSGPACNPNCTITASHNIASVVRNAPGDYTVTFINPMPDSKFAVVFGGPGITWGGAYNTPLGVGTDNNSLVTNTPSSFKIKSELSSSGGPSGNGADAGAISFSVFH